MLSVGDEKKTIPQISNLRGLSPPSKTEGLTVDKKCL